MAPRCPAAPSSPRSRPRPPLAAVGCGAGGAPHRGGARPHHRPLRDGLDAQHQPHRPVRRAAAGLVRRRRAGRRRSCRTTRRRPTRSCRSGAAEFGISLPGLVHGLEGRGRGHRLGAGGAAALGHARSPCAPTAPTSLARATSTARPTAASARPTRCRRCRRSSARRAARATSRPSCSAPSAYEALYAGQVDFTEPFLAWEGIEAQLRDEPLKTFDYADYGFPDAYSVMRHRQPALAAGASRRRRRRSCRPLQRGYQLAADDPAQGAKLLTDAEPGRVHRAGARLPQPGDAGRSATCRTRRARSAPQTLATVVGLLRLPLRRGGARGRRRQAADRAAGLRDLVHRRTWRRRDRCSKCAVAERTVGRWRCVGRRRLLLVLVGARRRAGRLAVDVSGVRPQVLPSPLRVVEQGWAPASRCWANTVPTLQVTAVGFAVSLAVGWAIAIAVDFSPWLRRALTPLLVASADAADHRDRPAADHLVRVRAAAEGRGDRAGHVLPHRHRADRGVRRRPTAQATNLLRSMGASRLAPVPLRAAAAAPCRRSSPRCGSASPTPSRARSSPSTWAPPPGWAST